MSDDAFKNSGGSGIDLNDLRYYFDSVEKDRFDQGVLGRRSVQVLAIKERLLSLNDQDFDAAVQTITKIVSHGQHASSTLDSKKDRLDAQRQAKLLYDRVEAANAQGTVVGSERIQKV